VPGDRLERLVQEIDALPAGRVRDSVVEIVQELMDLHGAGLERAFDVIHESAGGGQPLIDRLAQDPVVCNLLLLHDLHPVPLDERVNQALASVRPYLGTHGGNVELLALTSEGVAQLRLQGSCHGCASSAVTLKLAIEQALKEAAPDLAGIEVEGVVEEKPRVMPAGFIPLQAVSTKPGRPSTAVAPAWQPLGGLDQLEDGALRTVTVSEIDTIVCRIGESLFAYADACPGCTLPLHDGRVIDTALTCRHCLRRFDLVHAGRCFDDATLHLEPFPILHDIGGKARIAVPALTR
jgi:Fe-S cluster biogenesis protein NfuA/nitrite reductase/ring-hydroxylating ferredoxin subunit